MRTVAPTFRFAPHVRKRIDQWRLHVDIIGVTLVRLFLPLVQSPFLHSLLGIYNTAGWVVILTVDPTRLPEAATTRQKQRRAWKYALLWVPVLAAVCGLTNFLARQPMLPQTLTAAGVLGLAVPSYFDELLFRNTLQPKFRQLGLPVWVANGLQSTLYACTFWLTHAPFSIATAAWVLGFANGWIVYKFRSLWPAFALSLGWHVLWFA